MKGLVVRMGEMKAGGFSMSGQRLPTASILVGKWRWGRLALGAFPTPCGLAWRVGVLLSEPPWLPHLRRQEASWHRERRLFPRTFL